MLSIAFSIKLKNIENIFLNGIDDAIEHYSNIVYETYGYNFLVSGSNNVICFSIDVELSEYTLEEIEKISSTAEAFIKKITLISEFDKTLDIDKNDAIKVFNNEITELESIDAESIFELLNKLGLKIVSELYVQQLKKFLLN